MLTQYADRTVVFFVVDFKPGLSYSHRSSEGAAAFEAINKTDEWMVTGNTYVLRYPALHFLFTVTPLKLICQSIGASPWDEHLDQIRNGLTAAIDAIGLLLVF